MAIVTKRQSYGGFATKKAPGLYRQELFGLPNRTFFATGVPAFLGVTSKPVPSVAEETSPEPHMLSLVGHFASHIGTPYRGCRLAAAVQGFFENGGHWCYVVVLRDGSSESLAAGLDAIARLNTVDLVCTPDLSRADTLAQQQMVVDHCDDLNDRFAILDSRPGDQPDDAWGQWSAIGGKNAAVYYPWIKVRGTEGDLELVPPCGHIAGVYSRMDRESGVHKAPANEVLEGVIDLERQLTDKEQGGLNPNGVNCIRSFAGRGIRVWGARTLSGQQEWMYVNVRRLFLTAARWMDWTLLEMSFEPNDARLWSRIERRMSDYFTQQYKQGALKGETLEEAFYVKCDEETNPPAQRALGRVVTEVGLAPAIPYEFVVARLIRGARGAVSGVSTT
jgi:phage tail sheath protein FI